jgi:hypothetical protein
MLLFVGGVNANLKSSVTREEVAVAKNYLRNFRFREEYPETADENFDEVNHIPPFSILSSIMDRLDLYIGVDTTFKELDFEQDFLEYLPEDVIVMEEAYEDGEIVESVVEVPPHHEPVATTRHVQAHPVTPTAMSTPASPSKPPKEKSTTKKSTKNDNLTGTDVVSLNLTKKPRGRPPKKDKIAKAGPTRLREVMNADDIAPPSQSPSSTPAQDIAPTITIDPAQATPQRPATPPSSRNVSAVARNPFKDHSPSTPPPVHCASFRDDLPAQPAPTSPPKASTVSPPRTMSDSNVAAGVQPYYKVRTDATEAQDHYVSPANSMAVSVSSMSKGPSTSSNSPLAVYQTGIRSMPQANLLDHPMSYVIFDEGFTAQTPQSVESTMRTMDQSANSLPPKIASASSSTTGALAAQEMARSALDMTAVSKTKPQSAASAPSSKVGIPPSIAQTTMGQVPASNQPSPANSPSASTSKFIATPKNVPPANAPTQFNKQITQGKLKFNTKGSQGSPAPNPAPNQAHNSVSTSSEASSGKRTRDEEAGADIPEGQAAKKPRLEQQGHPKNSFIDKVKGDMRAMSNMLTSGKDAAVKASPIHSSDTLKDSKEGSTTQPATPTAAVLVNQPEEVDKSDEESMIHVAEVTLGVFTHPESSSDLQDLSMADNTTTPNLTNQPSMAENVATETSMTPTNASGSTPNLPAKSKKATGYKEEAARAAGQALLQQVATQATEAGDESKILETPPSILAEKTRSAARHARTTSQSSTESIENSRAKRAKTFTPEPIMSVGPALLQNVTSEGSSESKKLGAPPPTLAEKTRSAARHTRTNSQSSINSISTKQARTSTPEPSMTESPAQRRSSKLEVQIPTSKRAASELLGPTFDREESPAKKLKTREASSTTPANGATQAKIRPQKKTTNAKVTKKPAPKAKANSQSEATPQDGEASSSSSAAGATLAADPTPQVKPGSKKGSNGKKTTTPAKASAPPKAPPQPKAAPKSKAPAQPTSTPKPSATKGVTAKPKATVKFTNRFQESYTDS